MNIEAVLRAVQLAGAAAPAFKALFEEVLPLFSSADQDRLKSAYQAAQERSDAAHEDVQQAARDRQE